MKKAVTIIFTILSAILILDSMNAGHAIALFMLAGIIPGTNIALNADRMLELFTLLLGFVLARVCVRISRAITELQANNTPLKSAKIKQSRA